MTKQAQIYRQGDVWIYAISKTEYLIDHKRGLPISADPDKGVILAEGEVTGHHHRIAEAERVALRPLLNGDGTVRLLEVRGDEPVSLTHEEHETIKLPPGYYEVRIQREYEPTERTGQRYVAD